MTAILVDKFDNKYLYVFADGRATAGDVIHSDTHKKVEIYNDSIYVGCGDVSIIQIMIDLAKDNKLGTEAAEEILNKRVQNEDDSSKIIQITGHYVTEYDVILYNSPTSSTTKKINKSRVADEPVLSENNNTFSNSRVKILTIKYKLDGLPLAYGSGTVALKSAYLALLRNMKLGGSTKKYEKLVKEAFLATSSVVTSCNSNVYFERIEL